MTAPPSTRYLNADFDLSLRPDPEQATHGTLERQVRELSALSLLGAVEGDSALLRVAIPEAFLEYLSERGVSLPRLLRHPDPDPGSVLAPLGWNAEAMDLNRRQRHRARHPELDCVRRVNARSFALELEREVLDEAETGCMLEAEADLDRFLSAAPADSPWILKAEFGNAGLANRRLRRPRLDPSDRRFVRAQLKANQRLLVEPFRCRTRDWSMVFDVPFDSRSLRFHDIHCTADGGLIGALYDPSTTAELCRDPALPLAAERIAVRLHAAGYFGPVCVDGFAFNNGGDSGDGSRVRVRPLVDLNARHPVSDPVYRLWQALAPDRTLYFRFFAGGKLRLPDGIRALAKDLGNDAFDVEGRRGVLLGSPPAFGGDDEGRRPLKVAILCFGEDAPAALRLAERFRDRYETRSCV